MDSEDPHLGTGEYDPKRYWGARARSAGSHTYQAVCGFVLSDAANEAMHKVQKHLLTCFLKGVDLENAETLEFGCGVGRWAPYIKERGANYTGIDISQEMLRTAIRWQPAERLVLTDGTSIPFPDKQFDLVFSITVVHHNSYENQTKIFDEMLRVLKPEGHLLLLEAVSRKDRGRCAFNMFPRSAEDWVAEVTSGGRAKLVRLEFARWWLLWSVGNKIAKIVRRIKPEESRKEKLSGVFQSKWPRRVMGVLNAIDIRLLRFLPRRFSTSAAMLFEKVR